MVVLLRVRTPLGVRVRTTEAHWREIVERKHPVMASRLGEVRGALRSPEQVRRSRWDPSVHLYYRAEQGTPYHVCVVVKHLNGEGFIITAYRTDRIKEGDRVWTS